MGKTRTITLTGRRPVTIDEDQWPVIASSGWDDCDSQYEFQANRRADAGLKVRRHADGRVIVYGTYRYRTQFQGEDDAFAAAGSLLDAGDDDSNIIAAIGDTRDSLSSYDSLPEGWQPDWRMLADDCIADLPAEKL
jgi:hypothetical protein